MPTGTTIAATVRNTLPDSTVTVFGLTTRGAPGAAGEGRAARALRLFVTEGRRRGIAPRAMGFVLQRHGREPARGGDRRALARDRAGQLFERRGEYRLTVGYGVPATTYVRRVVVQ